MSLTDKQKRFCEEYVIDLNATQAAIRAGYSEKTANEQGSQNLAKLSIQAYITELQKEIRSRNDISVDMLVERLKQIGFEDEKDRVAALDKLMKHLGGYERDNTQKVPVQPLQFKIVSKDE